MAATYETSGLSPFEWDFLTRLAWAPADAATVAALTARRVEGWALEAAESLKRLGLIYRQRRHPVTGNPLYAVTRDGWAMLRGGLCVGIVLEEAA